MSAKPSPSGPGATILDAGPDGAPAPAAGSAPAAGGAPAGGDHPAGYAAPGAAGQDGAQGSGAAQWLASLIDDWPLDAQHAPRLSDGATRPQTQDPRRSPASAHPDSELSEQAGPGPDQRSPGVRRGWRGRRGRVNGRRATAASGLFGWWSSAPTHQGLARRIEPGVSGALAVTAALSTPEAARLLSGELLGVSLQPAAPMPVTEQVLTWLPAVVALGLAALALARRQTNGGLALRATALVLTAGAMAGLDPSRAALAVVWILAVAACYPFLLPRGAGRAVIVAAMTAMAAPLLVQAARSGVGDPAASLLGLSRSGTPTATSTLTLLGGMAVVAALGSAAAAIRSTLRATAHLAARRTQDAERAGAALHRVAGQDELTGLPNRVSLERETILALAQSELGGGGRVGLLMISLNRSGTPRDGIDAETDGEVVRQIARRIRASRPAHELVARCGEHRFAVLIPGIGAGSETSTSTARRLACLIEEPIELDDDRSISVAGAIGVAVSGPGLDTADELIRAAHEAMRSAERGGRTPWAVFDRAMRAHSQSQALLEQQLREAIAAGDIDAAFQVICPVGGDDGPGAPIAVEALARWTRPDGTAVPPQRFLPMAEDLGLGGPLGMLVLDRALTGYEAWRDAGVARVKVCVNVSFSQLLDPEFAHQVSARLGARGIPADALILEISAVDYRDGEQARSTLGMLRSIGIEIALDDFGRDGTSLATLRQLPISLVKLDHRLSADLGRNDAVAQAVAGMCRQLGLRTVAEGIETRAQLEAAQRAGLDAVQGFLIGLPGRALDAVGALTLR